MTAPISRINSTLKNFRNRISFGTASRSAVRSVSIWLVNNLSLIGREEGFDEGEQYGFNLKCLTQEVDNENDLTFGDSIVYHDGIDARAIQQSDLYTTKGSFTKDEISFTVADNPPQNGTVCVGMSGGFFVSQEISLIQEDVELNFSGRSSAADRECRSYLNRMIFCGAPEHVEQNIILADQLSNYGLSFRDEEFPKTMSRNISPIDSTGV